MKPNYSPDKFRYRASLQERLERRLIEMPNGCWEYQGSHTPEGYGQIFVQKGRYRLAHRIAWELATGETPQLLVCHRCDNPPCCNPDHLFLGTDLDNSRDARAKGRVLSPRGEKNPKAKLTEQDVRNIRAEYVGRRGQQTEIGRRYGLSQNHVRNIVLRKCWAHIGD